MITLTHYLVLGALLFGISAMGVFMNRKNLYSIHQKMLAKKLRFAEVMDIYGFRVIVNNIPAC